MAEFDELLSAKNDEIKQLTERLNRVPCVGGPEESASRRGDGIGVVLSPVEVRHLDSEWEAGQGRFLP